MTKEECYEYYSLIYDAAHTMIKQGLKPAAIIISQATYDALLQNAIELDYQLRGEPTIFGMRIKLEDLPEGMNFVLEEDFDHVDS